MWNPPKSPPPRASVHLDPAEARTRVAEAFMANFAGDGELGAAVALYHGDRPILSLASGWTTKERDVAWTVETLAPVYSATKGPAAATVLHALATHGLCPETLATRVWPGLPCHLTIGELLSHQAGYAALDARAEVADHAGVVKAIQRQQPHWGPPEHGYHPRTFGTIADELVRRITGAASLGGYWHEVIAAPHAIDFWIGLPEKHHRRVATLYPGRPDIDPDEATFYEAFNNPATLTRKAFLSPQGLHSVAEMNRREAWELGHAGFGGLGSAAGLAKFYGLLAVGELLPATTRSWLSNRLVDGVDRILLLPTAFSTGFMLDPMDAHGRKVRTIFGPNPQAFGHPGAGGSHAFADPAGGIGFAYVMNRMALGVLPHPRALRLVAAVYS